jgi:hypothetical protein
MAIKAINQEGKALLMNPPAWINTKPAYVSGAAKVLPQLVLIKLEMTSLDELDTFKRTLKTALAKLTNDRAWEEDWPKDASKWLTDVETLAVKATKEHEAKLRTNRN